MSSQSQSLKNFFDAIGLAEILLNIETNLFHDPPRQEEQRSVEALRGGTVVLMVGAFENFLREAFEEHLSLLNMPPLVNFNKLPEKLHSNILYLTLEFAMKGSYFQTTRREDRLSEIYSAISMLGLGKMNPQAFSNTNSNPNSETVKKMFSNVGIINAFSFIGYEFEQRWGKREATLFLSSKLDEIVEHRHRVAHTATVLNLSRADLDSYIKFLEVLATSLDAALNRHISSLKSR